MPMLTWPNTWVDVLNSSQQLCAAATHAHKRTLGTLISVLPFFFHHLPRALLIVQPVSCLACVPNPDP